MSAKALQLTVRAQVGKLALDVDLHVAGAGPLVIVGPNGAGKSTLLSLVLGARRPTHGRIVVGPHVLFDTAKRIDVPMEERRLGYVPQDWALLPHLTVAENVAFAVRASAEGPLSKAEAKHRTYDALNEVGATGLAGRSVLGLSGGERQRVALARALSIRPRALLLDEPLGALDAQARGEVRAHLVQTLRRLSLPTLVITHDPEDVRQLGGTVAVLEAGRITQWGPWAQLQAHPATAFVQTLTRR